MDRKFRKRRLSLIITMAMVLLVSQVVPAFAYDKKPQVASPSAILMDSRTERVLFEKNMEDVRTPASLTKLVTAILVVENLDLEKDVKVPKEAVDIYGNNIKLKKGEVLKAKDLLNAMLVYSANDAAIALAIETAGSLEDFYVMMNKKADEIGCKNTNFISCNGLTNDFKHHSTAYDLALIAKESMKYDTIRDVVKMTKCQIPATNKSKERKLKSTNRLLYDTKHKFKLRGEEVTIKYKYATGIKTGMMSSSGNCLAAGAKKDDVEFISVVLGSPTDLQRFEESKELLTYGMRNFKTFKVCESDEAVGKVKIKRGSKPRVKAYVEDGAFITLHKDFDPKNIETEVEMRTDLKAPVSEGTVVGKYIIKGEDQVVTRDIVIKQSIEKGGPWTLLGISDTLMTIIGVILALGILLLIVRRINKAKARRRRAARRAKKNQ